MSFLDAFLRGAAGDGLVNLSNKMEERDRAAAAAAQRERDKLEERAFREKESALARAARQDLAGVRGSGSRSAGGGAAGDDNYQVGILMQREGMSEAEARAAIEASGAGTNIFTQEKQSTESIDDGDRRRNVTTTSQAPDVEKYLRINRQLGEAMMRGPSMAKSNDAQLAEGERTRADTGRLAGMEDGFLDPAKVSEGQAAIAGKYVSPQERAAKLAKDEAAADASSALADKRNQPAPAGAGRGANAELTQEGLNARKDVDSLLAEIKQRSEGSAEDRKAIPDLRVELAKARERIRRADRKAGALPDIPQGLPPTGKTKGGSTYTLIPN